MVQVGHSLRVVVPFFNWYAAYHIRYWGLPHAYRHGKECSISSHLPESHLEAQDLFPGSMLMMS